MSGILPCSTCPFGAFELAIIGKGDAFFVAQIVVSLQKCDFETLDQIKGEYVLNRPIISADVF